MGLCKCPQRKVTNQFCYEHRVNVCGECLVTKHERCIVQSYLSWLQDSDYNPRCIMCRKLLSIEECVRLPCQHVFHWSCLDRRIRNRPEAIEQCPNCSSRLLPSPSDASAVAEALRQKLSTVDWGREALQHSDNEEVLINIDQSAKKHKQTYSEDNSKSRRTAGKVYCCNPRNRTINNYIFWGFILTFIFISIKIYMLIEFNNDYKLMKHIKRNIKK